MLRRFCQQGIEQFRIHFFSRQRDIFVGGGLQQLNFIGPSATVRRDQQSLRHIKNNLMVKRARAQAEIGHHVLDDQRVRRAFQIGQHFFKPLT